MRIIVGERGTGKTTELIAWVKGGHPSSDERRVIVCPTRTQADYLKKRYTLTDEQVIAVADREKLRGFHYVVLALDNADQILRELFPGQEIDLATWTGEPNTYRHRTVADGSQGMRRGPL